LTSARTISAIVVSAVCFFAALALPRPALGRDLAVDLSMRYIHQYLGNASDDHDCGPASVAMVLSAYGVRPSGLSDAAFVRSIRRTMGLPSDIGTVFDDLERAFDAYGLRYSLIPSSLPGEPTAEIQMMRDAIEGGDLVIPLVHGAVLGRGERYGDHWPVLAGFSADGGSVHLLDPDDQAPRTSDWVRGGDITISAGLLAQATLHAQPGPYALIIYPPGRGTSRPLQAGMAAHVAGTDGDGAYLRSSPGVGDNKLALLPEGTAVTVVGPFPAPNADGHDWIGVSVNGQQGYVAADYISAD
jgi:hypothetical protein